MSLTLGDVRDLKSRYRTFMVCLQSHSPYSAVEHWIDLQDALHDVFFELLKEWEPTPSEEVREDG